MSCAETGEADRCDVFISLYQSATVMPKSIRHIMVVHDIIPKLFRVSQQLAQEIELEVGQARHSACRTNSTRCRRGQKDLIRHLGISPSSVSVNRIDVDPIFKRTVTPGGARSDAKYHLYPGYLYFGGGLEWRKNAEGASGIPALLDREKSDHLAPATPPLVISGKLLPQLSPLVTDVERMAKELDLMPYVRILDAVPQRDLPALYAGAKIFFTRRTTRDLDPGLGGDECGDAGCDLEELVASRSGEGRGAYCRPDDVEDIGDHSQCTCSSRTSRDAICTREGAFTTFSWNDFSKKLLRAAIGD